MSIVPKKSLIQQTPLLSVSPQNPSLSRANCLTKWIEKSELAKLNQGGQH